MRNSGLTLILLIAATLLGAGCSRKPPEQTVSPNRVQDLRTLGKHPEADALARQLGIKEDQVKRELPRSYQETMDGGDDPEVPGCVCCYGNAECNRLVVRSVDTCYPGGEGGDDLTENIAGTDCVPGVPCAEFKQYKCSEVRKGSECRLRKVTCCGIETTSAFCVLEL